MRADKCIANEAGSAGMTANVAPALILAMESLAQNRHNSEGCKQLRPSGRIVSVCTPSCWRQPVRLGTSLQDRRCGRTQSKQETKSVAEEINHGKKQR